MKKLSKPKLIKLTITVLVIFGLLAAGYFYINQPVEGSMTTAKAVETSTTASESANGRYMGTEFAFEHPDEYGDEQKNPPSGNITEQVSLVTHTGPTGTLRITATAKNQPGGMPEDSAYQLRLRNTTDYTHETVTLQGQSVEKFSRKDKTEITYFISGPSQYAILAGTSATGKPQLPNDMTTVANSFTWLR